MHITRMERLHDLMMEVEAKSLAFDMSSWVQHAELNGDPDPEIGTTDLTCGTTCCALGWAGFDPAMQAEGLRITLYGRRETADGKFGIRIQQFQEQPATVEQLAERLLAAEDEGVTFYDIDVVFGERIAKGAGAAFFGLTNQQAEWLFMPDHYPKREDRILPSDVARRVRFLLEGGQLDDEGCAISEDRDL